MIDKKIMEEVISRLVKTYQPIAIYLFGSYAWGTPTEESDLDLLIVAKYSNEKIYTRSRPCQRALFGLDISKDLIVYTKDEFKQFSADVTTLGYKIKHDGELVYARA